jgi:hypothetical protein
LYNVFRILSFFKTVRQRCLGKFFKKIGGKS